MPSNRSSTYSAATLLGEPQSQWPNNIVTWDGPEDPKNPMNWGMKKKIIITILLSSNTMVASFGSSSFSPTFGALAENYGISQEVAILTLSLYVLGFAFGPLVFAPISELYGRKLSIVPPYFLFAIFLIAVATAENIQTVMICRFFAGLMASAPLSNVAGALADIWDEKHRALAVSGYVIAVLGGPTLGPVVGSAITTSYLGWRWTEYITAIMAFLVLAFDIIFLPETYAPVLLQRKARFLRHSTGNWALHSQIDTQIHTVRELTKKHLVVPLELLFTEPILFLIALYSAFVYGLLYLLFEALPIEYEEVRGWNPVQSSLVFLAVLLGVVISAGFQIAYQPFYFKQLAKARENGQRNDPEARLPPMMLGAVFFATGLFWFGGGAGVGKSPVISIFGAGCIGAGFVLIFQNAITYIIDVFTAKAASAQAANTFFRSIAGAGFALFATPMFRGLGVNWASFTLGFVAVALLPIPVLFWGFGRRLRGMSRHGKEVARQAAAKKAADEEKASKDTTRNNSVA